MRNTLYDALEFDIPHAFLIWHVWVRASAIACFFHPGLLPLPSRTKVHRKSHILTNNGHENVVRFGKKS